MGIRRRDERRVKLAPGSFVFVEEVFTRMVPNTPNGPDWDHHEWVLETDDLFEGCLETVFLLVGTVPDPRYAAGDVMCLVAQGRVWYARSMYAKPWKSA